MVLLFLGFFVIILLTNVIAGFSRKNWLTKILYMCLLICIIVVANSQTNNNDYSAYRYYYNFAGERSLADVEMGFILLSRLCRITFGLSYESFRLVFFIAMFSIAAYSIWQLSEHANLVFVLYFVLFFSVNITQIRYGMAEAIVLFATVFLKNKRPIIFCAIVILASTFHLSVIVFLAMLLGYYNVSYAWVYKNRNKFIVGSIIALIVMRVVSSAIPAVVNYINIVLGDSVRTTANFVGYDGNHYLKYLPVPFLYICLFKITDYFEDKNEIVDRYYEIVSYCSLFIYPIFLINRQLSRLSRTTVVLCLIPFVVWALHRTKKHSLFLTIFVLFLGYTFYCLSAYKSCLEPLLKYSIISELFIGN